jgi:hypothetical protein
LATNAAHLDSQLVLTDQQQHDVAISIAASTATDRRLLMVTFLAENVEADFWASKLIQCYKHGVG